MNKQKTHAWRQRFVLLGHRDCVLTTPVTFTILDHHCCELRGSGFDDVTLRVGLKEFNF